MSARQAVLGKIGKALDGMMDAEMRREEAQRRLANPPGGPVPAIGRTEDGKRVAQFCRNAEAAAATVVRVSKPDSVPKAVARYLRAHNLPARLRMGGDRRLKALGWETQRSLEIRHGAASPDDLAGISHAFAGIAETGTVALVSGPDNPSTINFLPSHHIVVVNAADIAGNLETVVKRLRRRFGQGAMPRLLNLVTGPSRSGDIEQTIMLGAHGPAKLHLIVVGG